MIHGMLLSAQRVTALKLNTQKSTLRALELSSVRVTTQCQEHVRGQISQTFKKHKR